jgi:hypothetical protein
MPVKQLASTMIASINDSTCDENLLCIGDLNAGLSDALDDAFGDEFDDVLDNAVDGVPTDTSDDTADDTSDDSFNDPFEKSLLFLNIIILQNNIVLACTI